MMMAGTEEVVVDMFIGIVRCTVLGLGAGAMVWTYTSVVGGDDDVGQVVGKVG